MKYFGIIAGIFTSELLLKNHIEETAEKNTDRPAVHGLVRIRKYHNYGAVLNAGQGNPKLITALSLILCVIATMMLIATCAQRGPNLLKYGLAFLLGGAYSNTYDRLKRHYVVDYISFPVKSKFLRNIVFNISDFSIMIGAVLSVIGYSCVNPM